MESMLCICLAVVVSSFITTLVQGEPTVRILPDQASLYVIQDDPLELTCVYKDTQRDFSASDPPVTFYKGGILVSDIFKKKMAVPANDPWALRLTITKNVTNVTDSGDYKCVVETLEVKIVVYIFQVIVTEGIYESKKVPVSLGCQPIFRDEPATWSMFWTKSSVNLNDIVSLKDRYVGHVNYTLTISSPERTDAGYYECVFRFGDDEVSQKVPLYASSKDLQCYVCTSETDTNCGDGPFKANNTWVKSCKDEPGMSLVGSIPGFSCGKFTLNGVINRKCFISFGDDVCQEVNLPREVNVCYCHGDKCNGQGALLSSITLMVILLFLSALYIR